MNEYCSTHLQYLPLFQQLNIVREWSNYWYVKKIRCQWSNLNVAHFTELLLQIIQC